MKIALNNLEQAWQADKHDMVAEAIRELFTRDRLRKSLQRMDEVGLPDYLRVTKEMKSPKKPFSIIKAVKSILP